MKPELPFVIDRYVRAVNTHDRISFTRVFADNAVVEDIGRTFQGIEAIRFWGDREIFAVNVTLGVVDIASRDGKTVVRAKVDGTFDRTGLPDPLFIDHHFVIEGDRVVQLQCQLVNETQTEQSS